VLCYVLAVFRTAQYRSFSRQPLGWTLLSHTLSNRFADKYCGTLLKTIRKTRHFRCCVSMCVVVLKSLRLESTASKNYYRNYRPHSTQPPGRAYCFQCSRGIICICAISNIFLYFPERLYNTPRSFTYYIASLIRELNCSSLCCKICAISSIMKRLYHWTLMLDNCLAIKQRLFSHHITQVGLNEKKSNKK
jgi:hypothetical protein